jgi:hypothetical protein
VAFLPSGEESKIGYLGVLPSRKESKSSRTRCSGLRGSSAEEKETYLEKERALLRARFGIFD